MSYRRSWLSLAAVTLAACQTDRIVEPTGPGARADVVETSARAPRWSLLAPRSAYPGSGFSTTTYAAKLDAIFVADAPDYAVGSLARYDLATNKWTAIPTTSWPIGKFRKIVHDPVGRRIVTYWDGIGEVWAVAETGGAWTRIGSDPNSHEYYEGTPFWDPVARGVATYGGYGFGQWKNVLWAYDRGTNHWALVPTSTPAPWPRFVASVAVDAERGRLFVASGEGSASGNQWDPTHRYLDDLWVLDLTSYRWTNLIPLGTTQSHVAAPMAYVPRLDALYRFGGQDGATGPYFNTLDVARVGTSRPRFETVATVGTPPSPRRYGGLYHDARRNRLIYLGGYDGSKYLSEVWELRFR